MNSNLERKRKIEEFNNESEEELDFSSEPRELNSKESEEVAELKEELSAEIFVDEAAIERVERQIDSAELIDRFEKGENLSQEEKEKLADKIKNRGWFGILNNLSAGDRVAYFNAPGGELAIKKLNDVYLGNQITDSILDFRNQLLREKMESLGAQTLSTDYKSGIFKLSESGVTELNQMSAEVDQEMTKFILEKVEEKLADFSSIKENVKEPEEAVKKLLSLKEKLENFGFAMSYGVSSVDSGYDENDKSGVALAVARAAEATQLLRPRESGEYGREFKDEMIGEEVEMIFGEGGLAEKIDQEFGSITSYSGEEYKIFNKNEKGFYVLNKDIARLVRKGKFLTEGEKDGQILQKISEYMRRINLIDLIKPETAEEISGQQKLESGRSLSEELELSERLSAKLMVDDLNQEERQESIEVLRADVKDSRFTSREVFSAEAVKIQDCAYVSLDVLDLGIDLVLSYEEAMQEMRGADNQKQKEIVLKAGDDITRRMREIRGKVLSIYQEHFNEAPLALVGGDEVTLALSERDGLEDFMLDLQKATASRVVKTAVATSSRHSDGPYQKGKTEVLSEHLAAQKRVELGVDYAKKIEERKRNLEQKGLAGEIDMTKVGEFLTQKGLDSLVIKETAAGGFETVSGTPENKKTMQAKEAVKILDELLKNLSSGQAL